MGEIIQLFNKDRQSEDKYYKMLEMFFKDYPSVVINYPEALQKTE